MTPKFVCSECAAELSASEVLDHSCNVGDGIAIPDVVGEIMAFRSWGVRDDDGGPVLTSLNGVAWRPGGWMVAECNVAKGQGKHVVSNIPVEGCTCGIYAAKSRLHLADMSYNRWSLDSVRVIGDVALSGKVIPGTQGYRALKARPVKLYVSHLHWRLVDVLQERYEVPVLLDNTLR